MNVRLNYSISFSVINAFEDRIVPNIYQCDLSLLTNTEDPRCQNVAFDRMKYMIHEIIENSVFIKYNSDFIDYFKDLMPGKIVEMPEEPFDQIVGMVLFCKLNSIFEEMLIVEEVKISSKAGGNIIYNIDMEDSFTKLESTDESTTPWWLVSSIDTASFKVEEDEDEISWEEIGLSWEEIEAIEFELVLEDTETGETIKTIPEKITKEIVKNVNFSPTILNGGRGNEVK